MRGRDELDFTVDPPPDLAIEVDISRSSRNKLDIYRALGVAEVWRYDGDELTIYVVMPDGRYRESECSAAVPELPVKQLVAAMAERGDRSELRIGRSFRRWMRRQAEGIADG